MASFFKLTIYYQPYININLFQMHGVKNKSNFTKFTDKLRKIFRSHFNENKNLLYENTYVTFENSLFKIIESCYSDQLTLEVKKYSYNLPGKPVTYFYRVTASFETNIYSNAFLKVTFDQEDKANKFYNNIAGVIKTGIKD